MICELFFNKTVTNFFFYQSKVEMIKIVNKVKHLFLGTVVIFIFLFICFI